MTGQPFPLFSPESRSLVKKYLTPETAAELQDKITSSGFTLEQAVQDAVVNPDSSIGIYAGDSESYTTFRKIFNPIIKDYHGLDTLGHCAPDFSDEPVSRFIDPDPEHRYIRSTRIRVARNLSGIPFTPRMTVSQRATVENRVSRALESMPDDLGGTYTPLTSLSRDRKTLLENRRLLFNKGDRFQEAAGMNRDWPAGRGIFVSNDYRFVVWINEEDHLRIISIDPDGAVHRTADRLFRALEFLGRSLEFENNNELGFLTACPSNLGTAMRAGVHIRLPNFNRNPESLEKLAEKFNLQVRGTRGEKTSVEDGVFDISNSRRLGISEYQCIHTLYTGVSAIVQQEKSLSR